MRGLLSLIMLIVKNNLRNDYIRAAELIYEKAWLIFLIIKRY